ncbi:hypothetical protein LCGC14_0460230 [marine sediment metagenome]|uniref:Uncharacterized protein n=1 Tax=marine sediment metagenome TaxID=412755 RepID=A0A0F9VP42_9ZZZZ
MKRINKYLRVEKLDLSGLKLKTDIWVVRANDGNSLGEVKWYGPWRQYALLPILGTVFNRDCLTALAGFLHEVNESHRRDVAEVRKTSKALKELDR